jgi:trk system potassium uptake protein TrkH
LVLAGLGLGTSFGTVAGLAVVDAALGISPVVSPLLTAIQSLCIVPWLVTVVRLDRRDVSPLDRDRAWPRARLIAVHLVIAGLVVLCVVEKWMVLADAWDTDGSEHQAAYRIFTLAAIVAAAVGLIGRGGRFSRFLAGVADHPARLMALSFGLTAVLGGFLLTLPQSLQRIGDASFVDALFTATSAVCVTGLTVNNVGETYTFFGQCVILALIQAGGLGIMVLSAFFAIVAGRSMRVRSSAVLAEMIDADSVASLRRMVLAIVLYTMTFEAVGVVSLYGAWSVYPEIALGPESEADLSGSGSLLWAAVFHSVSAFCNAGFALFENGLVPLVGDVPTNATVMVLITIGGIGFPVIDELAKTTWSRIRGRRPPRLSLHTRSALLVSSALVVTLAVFYLALEWGGSMRTLSWPERLLAASFQSVTADRGLQHRRFRRDGTGRAAPHLSLDVRGRISRLDRRWNQDDHLRDAARDLPR